MIVILDYGVGNIVSIRNMLKKVGVESLVSSDPKEVKKAEKLILPGVGHFDYCMSQIRRAPYFEELSYQVLENKKPILGVCAGCQMLFDRSEEGKEAGLGWISGEVIEFDRNLMPANLKVPHMGWTDVYPKANTPLFAGIEKPRFYFVHSFYVRCGNPDTITSESEYGFRFTASVQKGNIYGVQFHPEKSHQFGMKLYKNFAELG